MMADEIRKQAVDADRTEADFDYKANGLLFIGKMLQEIAAQLAEINENGVKIV